MNTKLFVIFAALFAIVVACVYGFDDLATPAFDDGQMTNLTASNDFNSTYGRLYASRNKRCNTKIPVCKQFMCNRCCGTCTGGDCITLMCGLCCG